jgi:hypothetical protein
VLLIEAPMLAAILTRLARESEAVADVHFSSMRDR